MNFTFNSISNTNFNLKVVESNHLNYGKKRKEIIEIPGRTGNLIISDNSTENLNVEIECICDHRVATKKVVANNLNTWLNSVLGYSDLIFSDGTSLKATFIGDIELVKVNDNISRIILLFSAYRGA